MDLGQQQQNKSGYRCGCYVRRVRRLAWLCIALPCGLYLMLTHRCGRGVSQRGLNTWRAKRSLRGTEHRSHFETRTEAALYFDLVGGDGQNFPADFNDAEQMAETLRDVRSLFTG